MMMELLFSRRVMALCGVWMLGAGWLGAEAASAQSVDAGLGPPVRITSPASHRVFYSPVDLPLVAYASPAAQFTGVAFYANGTNLGWATQLSSTNQATQSVALPASIGTNLFDRLGGFWWFVWSNAPPGDYSLTVMASGGGSSGTNLSVTSAPVNITVLSSTNGAIFGNFVSIAATDPVAVSGTNSFWVWPGVSNALPSWTNWPPAQWEFVTNWGPKPALFSVHRLGDISSNLTVNYSTAGTASNGLDYLPLPGFVNIPAGEAAGLIPIVPIDNGSNALKTIVLSLAASTNSPGDYSVGSPASAEAVIVHNWTRPLPWLLPGGAFHAWGMGPDGAWFVAQYSRGLTNWVALGTNQVIHGSMDFIDPNSSTNQAGFYRIVPVSSPPAQ